MTQVRFFPPSFSIRRATLSCSVCVRTGHRSLTPVPVPRFSSNIFARFLWKKERKKGKKNRWPFRGEEEG